MLNLPSPVRLVRIDADSEINDVDLDVKVGHRLWVEVLKSGQVLGVVERTADERGMSKSMVEEVVRGYVDIEPLPVSGFPDSSLPRASVVVCTIYQRVEHLRRTIESILALDYPDYEIIVVDNRVGAHASIPPFAGDERVKIVVEPIPGVSAARNCGFAESTGDFVAFTDDDVEVDPLWLRALGAAFANDASLDAIGGMVRPAELVTEPQLWFEEFYGGFTRSFEARQWSLDLVGGSDPMFPYSPGHFGAGCNMALRRTALQRIGGFDERLGAGTPSTSGEDLKAFMEVVLTGGRVAYVPSALVRHAHRRAQAEFKKQILGYGIGFAALFSSLIVEDPRHLWRIMKRVPLGLRLMLFPAGGRSPSVATSYPRWTQPVQMLGMAIGPLAFVRSAVRARKYRRT